MVHSIPSPAATEGDCMCSLQLPAHEYQALMCAGQLTSEALVLSFLDQIERHNVTGLKLHAVLSVCPRNMAVAQARRLDEERTQGKIRSGLHGIPIILKASIGPAESFFFSFFYLSPWQPIVEYWLTPSTLSFQDAIVTDPSLGMVTSAGSYAVASLYPRRNATLVDRLIEAGTIILGKGNLTEFCGLKSVRSHLPASPLWPNTDQRCLSDLTTPRLDGVHTVARQFPLTDGKI